MKLSRYAELAEFLDDRPEGRADAAADWKWLAGLAVAGYLVSLAMRLLELPFWSGPEFFVGQERLLATHDAYCWLAGAKGVNGYAGFGMARLAALLASLSGAPLWQVGFWGPPLLGSLTAVITGLWAWLLAGRQAAILPALLGALSPGFFYRSRLGYYDSDLFTQLMPLLLGFCLAVLVARCCSRSWLASGAERQAGEALPGWLPWLALGFGLVARVAHFAHDDVHPLGVALYWLALGLVAVTGLPGRRAAGLRLLVVYGLAAYGGSRHFGVEVFRPGLEDVFAMALAAGLAFAVWRRAAWSWFDRVWPWLAVLAAMALACGLLLPLGAFWAKALSYFKPVADAGLATGLSGVQAPSYPGITQSIREAKNVADLSAFFSGVSAFAPTGVAGLLGMAALLALRPAFALLLPLAVLGFASLYLGARFVMFGGPVFALGLGVGIHWLGTALVRRFGWSRRLLAWQQVLLAVFCLAFGYAPRYAAAHPTLVLTPTHAAALQDLKRTIPRDATVWTWWDYGYATQYFAERMTPADGGRHAGRDIFATALAFSTDSFRQAAQVIALSASQGQNLARRWDAMSAQAVKQELEALKTADSVAPPARPQYLVVTWENMLLLYWISFYGSWDVVAGTGTHARVMALNQPFTLDNPTGRMLFKDSGKEPLRLADATVLTAEGAQRLPLPEAPGRPHLLINSVARQAVLLDDAAYGSMAVQLLVGDPGRPEQSRYFKLLHEGFPLVRIYEVLPPSQGPEPQAKAKTP